MATQLTSAATTALNLATLPTTPGTLRTLSAYISANRQQMGYELLDFYGLTRSMLQGELRKPAARRASMKALVSRAYNLDALIEAGGALSSELVTA